MGNQPQKTQLKEDKTKNNEKQILNQAGKIAEELNLYQTQNELRQHRHLIARILIYGHANLITHFKKFNRERQKQILRQLKGIDYETTDLLYQNLIVKRLKQGRSKLFYQQYDKYLIKTKQQTENQNNYRRCFGEGEEIIKNKKVAILLFAGGISSRFKNEQNQILHKQIYTEKEGQKCLIQIALDKIAEKVQTYDSILIYLVHNQENHKRINQILSKYSTLKIKKILQNESPIVNISGKICLKNKQTFDLMLSSRGCGDIMNLTVNGSKLLQDIAIQGIQFICSSGVENIFCEIADPYLIGLLAHDKSASVAFKCTYPDNQNQNLKRLVFNKSQKCLQAAQLQLLLQKAQKQSIKAIRRSAVWMNDTVIRVCHLTQYMEKKKQKFNISQLFSVQKLQCTYWNPQTGSYNEQQHCYAFQRELSYLLLNDDMKAIGVMVERQLQFMPVITLREQNAWSDAYNQFAYNQKNQNKTYRATNNALSTIMHQ